MGELRTPCGVRGTCILEGFYVRVVEKHAKPSTMLDHVLQKEAYERWNAKSKEDVAKKKLIEKRSSNPKRG